MTNYKPDNREPLDQSSIQGRPATHEEIAYRDGYVRGRSTEQHRAAQERAMLNERRRAAASSTARTNDAMSAVLSIALFILALAGIGGLFFYFASRPQAIPDVENPGVENPDIEVEVPRAPARTESNTIELPNIDLNGPESVSPEGSSDGGAVSQPASAPSNQTEPLPQPEPESEASE